MRIFLAGATDAIGRRTMPLLLVAGHDVIGTSRHEHGIKTHAGFDIQPYELRRGKLRGMYPKQFKHSNFVM